MRVCFQLQVKPDRLTGYKDRHARVWPEMLAGLAETGWRNYSLFVREDGLLIGYFETGSLEDALTGMALAEVNARWQAEMGQFFEELDGRAPDEGFLVLEEIFNLEDQLAKAHNAPDEAHRPGPYDDPTQAKTKDPRLGSHDEQP